MSETSDGRRGFLKSLTASGALLASARGLALAEVTEDEGPKGPPLGLGVIGLGAWGREIAETAARVPWIKLTGLCDTYPAFLKKGELLAPEALAVADYRQLLDRAEVEAVVVATPSHQHKDIVLAALAAGKHVYCEAPLGSSIEDAKAIALAGQQAKTVFQGGLQGRSNALYKHVTQFVKSGVLGSEAVVQVHWSVRDSWRRMAPTPQREAEINWRLEAAKSSGLPGEAGIHQLDLVSQYLGALPEAVTGYGSTRGWIDGRDVHDTVQCVLEYPKGVRAIFSGTLVSSMGGAFTLFQGSNSTLMMRERRGWMIKEADSALLGWEVYARKDNVLDEAGIAMIADATKIIEAGEEPGEVGPSEHEKAPLLLAFQDFYRSIREQAPVACPAKDAYEASVVALKAHAAAQAGSRINYSREDFELA
jgi:predicted dehydrogenase